MAAETKASGLDLTRLSQAERDVLELLARGHTAKSIAGLTGQSEGAVNERLRTARRKTGVGSSRELARLLFAQKNWDEKIGMAGREALGTVGDQQTMSAWAWLAGWRGLVAMSVAMLAAAIAVASQTSGSSPSVSPPPLLNDPLVERIADLSSNDEIRRLHAEVRAQTRDTLWAERTETDLRSLYAALAHLRSASEPVRVICAANLCEVAGAVDGDVHGVEAGMVALVDVPICEGARKLGLRREIVDVGMTNGRPPSAPFVSYWRRVRDPGACRPR